MNKWKRVVSLLIALILIGISGNGLKVVKVNAADSTVKIFIGDSKTPRHHRAIAVGSETEELSFSLKDGTIKSSSYASNNLASFKIKNTTEGKCIVEGMAEGTGLVTLTVKTEEGNTYKEKLFISVYTRIGSYSGVANKNTNVYRGATDNAGVENKDDKGDIKKNTKFSVTASCDKFYIIKTLDGTVYDDNQDTGFVKKSDIDILADSLKINEDSTSVKISNHVKLNTTIAPEIVASKKADWTSSNTKVAVVDENGQVSGKTEGTVTVTATAKDGSGKKDSVYVSVYSSMSDTAGYLNADSKLYKVANGKLEIGSGVKSDTLTIVGQCGDYYRVKMDKRLENAVEYLYVPKNSVTIPVKEIKLSKYNIQRRYIPNTKFSIKTQINPEIASNQQLLWKSSDTSIVTVKNGKVVVNGKGKTQIVVSLKSNKEIKAICNVNIIQPKKEKVRLKKNGLKKKEVRISWNNDSNAEYYEVYRKEVSAKKYRKLIKINKNINEYVDKTVKYNKNYLYYIKSIFSDDKGKFFMDGIASSIKINKDVVKSASNNRVRLEWDKIAKASGYTIYKYNKKTKKYTKIKNVKKSKVIIDKLKENTKYKFMIKAYRLTENKKKYFSQNYIAKIKTLGKVNGFFADKIDISGKWKNINLSEKPLSSKKMNSFSIYNTQKSKEIYPLVKYNYSKKQKVLYIHLYVDIIDKSQNATFKYYKNNKISKKSKKTYRELVESAIKEYWSVSVKGNVYDFGSGINFKTKVVLHKKGEKTANKKQKYTKITIGDTSNKGKVHGNYWFFAVGMRANGEYLWSGTSQIKIATQETLFLNHNTYGPEASESDYKQVVGHEIGHILGLNDGYKEGGVNRSLVTNEIGTIIDGVAYHVMDNKKRKYGKVFANDIEMIIQAQANAVNRSQRDSWQSYKNHTMSGIKYNKSVVIRKEEK